MTIAQRLVLAMGSAAAIATAVTAPRYCGRTANPTAESFSSIDWRSRGFNLVAVLFATGLAFAAASPTAAHGIDSTGDDRLGRGDRRDREDEEDGTHCAHASQAKARP